MTRSRLFNSVETADIQSWTAIEQRIPGWLPAVLLLIVLAFQVAAWTWVFMAPHPLPPAPPPPRPTANVDVTQIVNAALFGKSSAASASESSAPAVPMQLRGILADRHGPAYAIIAVNGTEDSFRLGKDIVPGIRLEKITPKYVMVRRNGQLERLDLEGEDNAGTNGSPSPAAGGAMPPGAPTAPITIPRVLFESALRDPGQLISAGRLAMNPSGGLLLVGVSPGGLYEKLGLLAGDVVKSINGQPVNSPEQALSLYKTAISAGHVQVDIIRAGKTQQLNYILQ